MAPTHRSSRRSRHYHANKLKSVRYTLLADTKRVLQEIVDDDSVSLDEFRLMSNLTGATLDCFFRLDDTKRIAVPLQTKADIVKQLLYTDRKIRHHKAKEHSHANKSSKRAGGIASDISLTSVVWNNRERLMNAVLNNVFPPLMLALGVPPQYQSFIRKAIEEFVKWCGKTKSSSTILDEKEKKIEQLVKEIEESESIKTIDLKNIQDRSSSNLFLENSLEKVKDAITKIGKQDDWNKSVDKAIFAEYVHTYTHNVVNDVVPLEKKEAPGVIDAEKEAPGVIDPLEFQLNLPIQQLAAEKLKKINNMQTTTTSKAIKIKKLEDVIKFLQIILQNNVAKKKYTDSTKREEWLSKRVEYINKDIKNPILHKSIKNVKSHPLMVFAVMGTLSFVTTRWLLQEVEEDDEESFDEATADPEQLQRRENQVKHRVQKLLRNVKTRHLITSVPVLLCVLFVTIKRHTMGQFSDLLAGTVQPTKDKIALSLTSSTTTYADAGECLRKTDTTLHESFKDCSSVQNAYYIICKAQYNRRNQRLQRSVLNSHLIRKDGHLRTSVAEVALAVKKNYQSVNVMGRLNTKRKAVFGFGTKRRSSTSKANPTHKKRRLFGTRRRSSQ